MVKNQQTLTPRPIRDIQAPSSKVPIQKHRLSNQLARSLHRTEVKIVLVVAVALVGALAIRQYTTTRNELAQNDPVKLAAHIGKFLELPPDEAPTLATVKDIEKLRGQSFFEQTQDGDQILVYAKSGKAVVYRPSTKKVIKYMPINLADSTKK